jgi:hypothetical protein
MSHEAPTRRTKAAMQVCDPGQSAFRQHAVVVVVEQWPGPR